MSNPAVCSCVSHRHAERDRSHVYACNQYRVSEEKLAIWVSILEPVQGSEVIGEHGRVDMKSDFQIADKAAVQ